MAGNEKEKQTMIDNILHRTLKFEQTRTSLKSQGDPTFCENCLI
jgi:hypothetical protein